MARKSKGSRLTAQIQAHYSRDPDVRLWRNETALVWAGKLAENNLPVSATLLYPNRFKAGLAPGSADLIGIGRGGRFLALEVKAGKDRVKPEQQRFLDMVTQLGGIAGVVRSIEDAEGLLGPPPQ